MSDNDQNNFSLGFVVGVLTGVAAYFLTKTKEGQEIKKKALGEWKTIKKKLEDDGVITGKEPDLAEIISIARTKLFEVIGEDVPKKKKKSAKRGRRGKSSAKTSEKTTQTKTRKKKMFKGI